MNKKDKIIQTATNLFVKQGFENTPTSQISKESGIGTGTLFYHFKTKEDLINFTYQKYREQIDEFIVKDLEKINQNENLKIVQTIWNNLIKWKFENKIEHFFIEKYFESSYYKKQNENPTQNAKILLQIFEKAKKQKIIKNISFDLFQSLTLAISKSFLEQFYKINKLDKKQLKQSFEIYWDTIKQN